MNKKLQIVLLAGVLLIVAYGAYLVFINLNQIPPQTSSLVITNFEECVANGNPVMESYPRQCRYEDQIFVESVGNELEKTDLIRLDTPLPNQTISSPLVIKGQARGFWFFEASFPVILVDWDGKIIAQGLAKAKGDWMTTEFVPFEADLVFTVDKNVYSNKGSLILRKDNPSGLPQNDDVLEIPIVFAGITGIVKPAPLLSEAEARVIAEKSCIKGGGALGVGIYNENSKTWWYDANLNFTKPGCNPACVVSEETKTAEINWRCTGAIPPETKPVVIKCLPEQRNADVCNEIYQPVCAKVNIQCFTTPCNPIKQTFSNACHACQNSLVELYTTGDCQVE